MVSEIFPTNQTSTWAVSGTLNLVLANRNGFVVAADGRGTNKDGGVIDCSDDFQKLFRTGKRSAMAIAGLLATPKGT